MTLPQIDVFATVIALHAMLLVGGCEGNGLHLALGSGVCYTSDLHFGMDANGAILEDSGIEPRTPAACCARCHANPDCKAFTLNNYNVGAWSTCVLKSEAKELHSSPFQGTVYGVMQAQCTKGSYILDSAVCTQCAGGRFSDSINSPSCTACQVGRFNIENGSAACDGCPMGSFNQLEGLSTCSACRPGTFSANLGASFCQNCSLNHYSDKPGQHACEPVGYFMAYLVGTLCSLGMILFFSSILWKATRLNNRNQSWRQGFPLPLAHNPWYGWSEVMSAIAESYVMIAVSVEILNTNPPEDASRILQYVPKLFRPALLQFTDSSFVVEFFIASAFPLVVLLATVTRAMKGRRLTLSGVQSLASNNLIRLIFDSVSTGVVKKLVGASLCEFSSSTTPPHLIMAPYIYCEEPRQVTMAIVGSFGIIIWYFWIAVLVRRKSFDATRVTRLYDFVAITVISQAHVVFGVVSAAFSHNEPKAVLVSVFSLTIVLSLLGPLTGGGPCRFTAVNRVRLAGTLTANAVSVLMLLYWLSAKESWKVWQLCIVMSGAVCVWGLALLVGRRHERSPVTACNDGLVSLN